VLITLGAGNIWQVGEAVLRQLGAGTGADRHA